MSITEFIKTNEELKELTDFPYLYVYRVIEILVEKGYLPDVDKI